jgi:predicted phage terminase large subunit-like protein
MIDLATLTDEQAAVLLYDWDIWSRPKQKEPPGDWRVWLILAGRGFGKTRTGAEWTRGRAWKNKRARIGLIGRTVADVRDVMVEGESGILACSPPWFRPLYEPSKRRLTWPNGVKATTYSADEPDSLRGPQHTDLWCDEPASWQYEETWDQAMFGLRLGSDPRCVATTTPRPTKLIKMLIALATTYVTTGSTYENKANLALAFLEQIIRKYEGTRLGRQELNAEILDDVEGALWKRWMIEDTRVTQAPTMKRVIVAIDPAVTAEEGSDETGIIVAGLGMDGHGYVLSDKSLRSSPQVWAETAITAYHAYKADRIIAEVNNGGDMVEMVIQNIAKESKQRLPYLAVHASRGKQTRAEPVSALYERGLIHHVGTFPDLEDQLCSWEPGVTKSPDRLDALVWAFTNLIVDAGPSAQQHLDYATRYATARQAQQEKAKQEVEA